jgi:flagellar hook protein FlgE
LSHTPNNFETFFEQDGFKSGVLKSVNVGGDGVLEGLATNGVRIPIAQLALASFVNEQALLSEGNNLYSETLNSGSAIIGKGLTGSRGQVVLGNLELSNVDIAYEFTQLIIAQRGFSANARTVTVTDQLLEELTGIVR